MVRARIIRRAIGAVVATALIGLVSAAVVASRAHDRVRSATTVELEPPHVLFIGDSLMDQQGNHAAFLLRQSGVTTHVQTAWGSSLLTGGQYRSGRTMSDRRPSDDSVHWLSLASELVENVDPTLVVVELNHNYWWPFPTDAHGVAIADLGSIQARRMIAKQVHSLVAVLQSAGADVVWVAPTPSKTHAAEIWSTMRPVLQVLGTAILDPNAAVRKDGSRRRTSAPDCADVQQDLWMPDQVHLTRFGASVTGTTLAEMVAARIGIRLIDAAVPGDRVVALVPATDGYYLVQCDGSVFAFGSVPIVISARSQIERAAPVVDARAASDGGLILVSSEGTEIRLGAVGGLHHLEELGASTTRRKPATDPIAQAWDALHPPPRIADTELVTNGGYTVRENGEVESWGDAVYYGDAAHLARFTHRANAVWLYVRL